MKFPEPVTGGRLEKAADLPAGVHEITASPLIYAHIGAGIFIKGGAVIFPERIVIYGKMDRYEIQNHANPVLVALADKSLQAVRCPVAGGRAEKSGFLIAPGFITGMLRKRHDFQIVITIFFQVRNEQSSQLLIGIPAIRGIGFLFPGTKMQFINIYRFIVGGAPASVPFFIVKMIVGKSTYDRCRTRPYFGIKCIGIGMIQKRTVFFVDPVFITHARGCVGDRAFPEITVINLSHSGVRPAVKVPDYADMLCCRSEGTKGYPRIRGVRSQKPIAVEVLSRIKIIKFHGCSCLRQKARVLIKFHINPAG